METQSLPVHHTGEPKLNGTTNLLPVTDLNLHIEKVTRSSGQEGIFCRIGPRFLVGNNKSLAQNLADHCRSALSSEKLSYLEDSVAVTNNGSVSNVNGHAHTPAEEDETRLNSKKRVNICTEDPEETTALRRCSETSDSAADRSITSTCIDNKCLTMTGTIKRGKKAGQNLDVRLNISREELEVLEANIAAKDGQSFAICGFTKGPHIFLWTLLCFPVATIISSIYSFYIGTLMWYNVFTYVTEEKSLLCRILLSPFLIILYPFLILVFTFGLGVYAGLIQLSWFLDSWSKEIMDWEKGFYGWLCSAVGLEDCSPYEVVVLTDIQVTATTADQEPELEPPQKDDSQNSIPDLNPAA